MTNSYLYNHCEKCRPIISGFNGPYFSLVEVYGHQKHDKVRIYIFIMPIFISSPTPMLNHSLESSH